MPSGRIQSINDGVFIMSEENKSPTYGEVWKTLSAVDVSSKIELKGKLSYLSWAWAWGTLMEYYPEATYEFLEPEVLSGGSVLVNCKVTIGDLSRTMWLACMDFKMQADINPDAIVVNKTKMRCLVKCLGMFGLGHYIYAGEDLPQVTDGQKQQEPDKVGPPSKDQELLFSNVADMQDLQVLWASLSQEDKIVCAPLKNAAKDRFS